MSQGVEVTETLWIPMSDGTRLAARLWLPAGASEAPVPCLLEYIPYRRRDLTRIRDEGIHPHFAAAGYASIRVDIRGYGDSEGIAEDEYSHQETADGVEVIAWLAAQPWCSGAVGMFGKSWGAFNALQVAAQRPPALKAIAPVMGTDDRFAEDIHFYGNALANDNFWWGSIMQLYNALPPDPATAGAEVWQTRWKTRLDAMRFWPAMWLAHQTRDETWQRGSVCESYDDIEIPVFYFGGWADLYRDTAFRLAENLKGPVEVLMGPWSHVYPHDGAPGPKADFIAEALRFWDRWLKGIAPETHPAPLRFFLQESCPVAKAAGTRTGVWAEEEAWPSPNVTPQELWLNETGLEADPAQSAAPLTISSPQTFGAASGDMCSFATPGDLPADGRLDAGGALAFRGAPLPAALDILGQPSLSMRVCVDKPQATLTVLLFDEAPDGELRLITRGFANLSHRESRETPTPVTPGQEISVAIPLRAIGYRIPAGHRLCVHVATAYWPVLWPAPERVTATLPAGCSVLQVPVRGATPDGTPPPVPPRRSAPSTVTPMRDGAMERTHSVDFLTGIETHRTYIDGDVMGPSGGTRLDGTGTVLGNVSERVYEIHPDDPLSARARMTQTASFERDDWHVTVKTWSEQTADARHFHLSARTECWVGDTLFHETEWQESLPRNCM